eukprot:g3558.t1
MVSYEVVRKLTEVIFESLPQSLIQLSLLTFACDGKACNLGAEDQYFLFFKVTPLENVYYNVACEKGDLDLVKALVEGHDVEKTGISVDEMVSKEGKNSRGKSQTPLLASILQGRTAITTYLVKECKVDGSGGPLVVACEKGDLDLVKALVEGHDVEKTGISVDEMVSKEGKNSRGKSQTPLLASILQGRTAITTYLVKECKVDGSGGQLVVACEKGDFDSVKALVEGHDVEKTGMSVDEMVSKEGKLSKNGYSRTPLQSAAEKEQFEIVQFLVTTCTNKVDIIGQKNSNGSNSLHFAAGFSKKNVQTLQFLIDNYNGNIKTIINQKTKSGNTPLDWAYASTTNSPVKNEIVSLLRKYGGKANKYDKNGNEVEKGKGDLNDLLDNASDAVS